MANDVSCRDTRETSMSEHQDRLQQKSPEINDECGALDDQDLAMVTGGDKAKAQPKEFPTETMSLSYAKIVYEY
jgi:hypothetical protein